MATTYNVIGASTAIVNTTFGGTIATYTFPAHGVAVGQPVTITNAVPTAYNGTFNVLAAPAYTFSWIIPQNVPGAATGQGIVQKNIKAATLTASGSTATFTGTVPHGLYQGCLVSIYGASPSAYNGTYIVNVINHYTFTYTMGSSPANATVMGTVTVGCSTNTASSVTYTGGVVTFNTSSAHGLYTGALVSVSGATPAGVNGNYVITVTSATQFTYSASTGSGTATGTIVAVNGYVLTSSITSTTTTATVNTTNPHGLYVGAPIRLSGADVSNYNGVFSVVSVPSSTQFTITITSFTGSAATQPVLSYNIATTSLSISTNTASVTVKTPDVWFSFAQYEMITLTGSTTATNTYNGIWLTNVQNISGVFMYQMLTNPGGSATVQGVNQVGNIDNISWVNGDGITIANGATLVCNTNQTRFLHTLTVSLNSTFQIVNSSTSAAIRFLLGSTYAQTGANNPITLSTGSSTFSVVGNWISLGSGNGGSQTLTSPYPLVEFSGYDYVAWVEVETSPGSGLYEMWRNETRSYGQTWHWLREDTDVTWNDPYKGKSFRQPGLSEATILANPAGAKGSYSTHWGNSLIFGEADGGYPIPTGCNVRLPNIVLTDGTPCDNSIGNTGSNEPSAVRTNIAGSAGIINMSNCYMFLFSSACAPTTLTLDHVLCYRPFNTGFTVSPSITNCGIGSGGRLRFLDVSATSGFGPVVATGTSFTAITGSNIVLINNAPTATIPLGSSIATATHQYGVLSAYGTFTGANTGYAYLAIPAVTSDTAAAFTAQTPIWRMRDDLSSAGGSTKTTWTIGALNGGTLRNIWCTALTNFTACDSVNVSYWYAPLSHRSQVPAITLTNVTNSTLDHIYCYGNGDIYHLVGANNTLTNIVHGWGTFNESPANQTYVARIGGTQTGRFYYLPNGTALVAGTPYYIKTRSYRNQFDLTDYKDNPITYSVTPFVGRSDKADLTDSQPYFFSVVPWNTSTVLSPNFTWVVHLQWHNASAFGMPFYNSASYGYQIWRNTVAGQPTTSGTQIYQSVTAATVSYDDITVTPGTTYYYTLRYYYSLTGFNDSAQQIAIIPSASAAYGTTPYLAQNMLVQSNNYSITWTTGGSNVPTVQYQGTNIYPCITDSPLTTATSGVVTKLIWSAAGDGYVTQSATCLSSTAYTFSVYVKSDLLSGDQIVISLYNGASLLNSTTSSLSQLWTRVVVTATSGASQTTMVVRVGSNSTTRGHSTYQCYNQLEPGSAANSPLYTTTAAIGPAVTTLPNLGVPAFYNNVGASLAAYSKGARPCIDIGHDTVLTSSIMEEVFIDVTPVFTPSKSNMIYSNYGSTVAAALYIGGNYSNLEVNGFTSYGINGSQADAGNATGAVVEFSASSGGNAILRNFTIGNMGIYVAFMSSSSTGLSSNVTVQNCNLTNTKGPNSYVVYPGNLYQNTVWNIQNVFQDRADCANTTSANSGLAIKGCSMGWSSDAITPLTAVRPIGDIDGIYKAGAQFDYIFGEGCLQDPSKGLQYLLFSPSALAVKPYSISGTGITFDNAGNLCFANPNESITYTWPWRIKGINGFQNIEPVIQGAGLGDSIASCYGLLREFSYSSDNYTWSSFQTMNAANLSAVGGLSSSIGFFFKVRLTVKQFISVITLINGGLPTTGYPYQIQNASSSPTATAMVTNVIVTAGSQATIWLSSVSGFWANTSPVYLSSSPSLQRFTTSGTALFGSVYPQGITSQVNAMIWYTTTDRTALYPCRTPLLTVNNTLANSNLSAFNASTGAWLETVPVTSGTYSTMLTPWDADITTYVQVRKPGYQHFQTSTLITRNPTSVTAAQVAWTHISASDPGSPNITFTDHETSPVTWNGKQWRFTIRVLDSSTADTVAQWFYWNTCKDALLSGYRGTSIQPLIIEDGSTYKTIIGTILGDPTPQGGCRVIDVGGNYLTGFTMMQSNDGSYYTPVVNPTLTVSGLITGSDVVLTDPSITPDGSGSNVVAYWENIVGTSQSYTYTYSAGKLVDIGVFKPGYRASYIRGVSLASGNQNIPVSQPQDPSYL